DLVGIAPALAYQLLDLGVGSLCDIEIPVAGKDHLSGSGCKDVAAAALAGLDYHGVALGRARYGERAARAYEFSFVVEPLDLVGITKNAALTVDDKRVFLPAFPMANHGVDKFVGAVVAGIVIEMLV